MLKKGYCCVPFKFIYQYKTNKPPCGRSTLYGTLAN